MPFEPAFRRRHVNLPLLHMRTSLTSASRWVLVCRVMLVPVAPLGEFLLLHNVQSQNPRVVGVLTSGTLTGSPIRAKKDRTSEALLVQKMRIMSTPTRDSDVPTCSPLRSISLYDRRAEWLALSASPTGLRQITRCLQSRSDSLISLIGVPSKQRGIIPFFYLPSSFSP